MQKSIYQKALKNVDGWSEDGTHFIELFLTCPETTLAAELRIFLLSFSTLLDETNFNAANHVTFIRETLKLYNINEEKLVCLIGDNCATNKLVADLMEVPLLGLD